MLSNLLNTCFHLCAGYARLLMGEALNFVRSLKYPAKYSHRSTRRTQRSRTPENKAEMKTKL